MSPNNMPDGGSVRDGTLFEIVYISECGTPPHMRSIVWYVRAHDRFAALNIVRESHPNVDKWQSLTTAPKIHGWSDRMALHLAWRVQEVDKPLEASADASSSVEPVATGAN